MRRAGMAAEAADGAPGDGAPGDAGRADAERRRAVVVRRQAKSVSPAPRGVGGPARELARSLELGGKEAPLRERARRRSADARKKAEQVCSPAG